MSDNPQAEIAVIGGSGLYDLAGLADVQVARIDTPFGKPSDDITVGRLHGRSVAFLPRHGRGHRLSPSEVNQRANIYALKLLGVQRIIAVSAVGSLKEHIHPLEIVVPDQLIDCTQNRDHTFFGDGVVAHVGFADPFCQDFSAVLLNACRQVGATVHPTGAYVCIEGPQFSTKAESNLYRSWGAHVIGMTAIPEAKLAREAEICYGMLALVTDYDVWHQTAGPVSVEAVVAVLNRHAVKAREIISRAIERLPVERSCGCATALDNAIITAPEQRPAETLARLAPLLGRALGE